jgi:hypothetical protein
MLCGIKGLHGCENLDCHLLAYDNANLVGGYHFRRRYCLYLQGTTSTQRMEPLHHKGKKRHTHCVGTKQKEMPQKLKPKKATG